MPLMQDQIQHPVSQNVSHGHFVTFNTGDEQIFDIQWYHNGVALAGESNETLRIESARAEDVGLYQAHLLERFPLEEVPREFWTREAELLVQPQQARPGMLDPFFSAGQIEGDDVRVIVGDFREGESKPWQLYLGGQFDAIDGHSTIGVAQVGINGVVKRAFRVQLEAFEADGRPDVRSIVPFTREVEVSGEIIQQNVVVIGGQFAIRQGGVVARNLALLNASTGDLIHGFNGGTDGTVEKILKVDADHLIIGGDFDRASEGYLGNQNFSELARNNVARYSLEGVLDEDYVPPSGADFQGEVKDLLLDGDGILVGSTAARRFYRLDGEGDFDGSFPDGLRDLPWPNLSAAVFVLNRHPSSGKIYAGGEFGLARLNADGTLDTAFRVLVAEPVQALAVASNGDVYIGGNISLIAGEKASRVSRILAEGRLDKQFDPEPVNDSVKALFLSENDLYVGGGFSRPHDSVTRLFIREDFGLVVQPAKISSHPRSQSVVPTHPVTLSVLPLIVGPKRYQWLKDGQVIPDATGSQFRIDSFASEDEGSYRVIVTDLRGGSETSRPARLRMADLPLGLPTTSSYSANNLPRNFRASELVFIHFDVTEDSPLQTVRLFLDLNHENTDQLIGHLTNPDGERIELFSRPGRRDSGSGIRTTFDDAAADLLSEGVSPWLGSWKPDGCLNHLARSQIRGTWTLAISSRRPLQPTDLGGRLNAARLELVFTPTIPTEPDWRRLYAPEQSGASSKSILNFATLRVPDDASPILYDLEVDADGRLSFSHERWSDEVGVTYCYERATNDGWVKFQPEEIEEIRRANFGNYRQEVRLRTPAPVEGRKQVVRLGIR